MHLNIPLGEHRQVQLIVWTWEDREHWGCGYGRWPTGETLAAVTKHGWTNLGFRAFVLGIFEIRYWPNQRLVK